MIEREVLEREIHRLRQIIRADAYSLASKSTPPLDRARLQKQMRYAPPRGTACWNS